MGLIELGLAQAHLPPVLLGHLIFYAPKVLGAGGLAELIQ